MKIRYATPADHKYIAPLLHAAFPEEDIASFVRNLRNANEYLAEWVAEKGGSIIGHIGFTRANLETDEETISSAMLTPLAVLPSHQNQGVGSALVKHAHVDPILANIPVQIVLGHPTYYPRFGYKHDDSQPIECKWSKYTAFMIRGVLPGSATLNISKIIEDA